MTTAQPGLSEMEGAPSSPSPLSKTPLSIISDALSSMWLKHSEAPHLPKLKIDQAYLVVNSSSIPHHLDLYTQSTVCEGCPMYFQGTTSHGILSTVVNTTHPTTVSLVDPQSAHTICNLLYSFGERGTYSLNVTENEEQQWECRLNTQKAPVNIYIPLIIAAAVYAAFGLLWILANCVSRQESFQRWWNSASSSTQALDIQVEFNASQQPSKPAKKERLKSLDTFRGIAIVVMIFVNYGGGGYWFFEHALWNGLTVADLVFPWFIWIMGVSLALSLRSLLRKAITRKMIFMKIVKRSIILFALGIILNTHGKNNDLSKLRIPGVLQRFGISYFVVASVHLMFAQPNDVGQGHLRDITMYWVEWVVMLCVLAVHVLLTFLLPVPGCPTGYLGPGGLHMNMSYPLCTGGAAGYIDRIVLGDAHIYQHPSCKVLYDTSVPYDPEGILGCLTSIFLVFLGLQAGKILLTYQGWSSRVNRWCIWGVATGAIAAVLCKGTTDDGWIPVNKNLWSVSFILATGSMAFLLLAFCYLVIDIQKWWSGAPLYQPGMNSILLYVGHSLVHGMFPWSWRVSSNAHWEELLSNLVGTTLWVIIAIWLHAKKFFLAI